MVADNQSGIRFGKNIINYYLLILTDNIESEENIIVYLKLEDWILVHRRI